MRLYINRVSPVFPSSVFLGWDLIPDNGISGNYTFTVGRSGSPNGPFTTISQPLTNAVNFTDRMDQTFDNGFDRNEEVNLLSLAREIYYNVTCTSPNGVIVTSPAVNLDGLSPVTYEEQEFPLGVKPDENSQRETDPRMRAENMPRMQKRLRLLRRKILRDEYISFRECTGITLVILKRKHFGTRCTNCYDPLTRASTQSKCPICYGTSWIGGYFTGIETYGQARPAPVQSATSPEGVGDSRVSQFTVLAYPKIEESDIIVELYSDRRWQVMQVVPTELRRVMVHQRIVAAELGRQSIEYYVPTTVPALSPAQFSGTLLTNGGK
jgi:hypothetical protein